MNIAHTIEEIRAKHDGGHDLLREEVSRLFEYITILENTSVVDADIRELEALDAEDLRDTFREE